MKRPRGAGARRSTAEEIDAVRQDDEKQSQPGDLQIQEQIEQQKQQDDEVDECIAILETTITDDGIDKDEKGTQQQHQQQHQKQQKHPKEHKEGGSLISKIVSWPMRLVSNTCCWLTLELGRLLDDHKIARAASSDEPGHFLPSVVVFLLVLLFVNNYGDTLDRVTRNCVSSAFRTLRGGVQLLSVLTWDDIEALATASVVVLFWIGAFRIVVNIITRLVDAPKFIAT